MPAFAYQALDASGRTQRGVLQGDTARAVRGALRERGLNPLDVAEVREEAGRGRRLFERRGLGGAQLALLTRQLATLIGAGLPIDEALGALSEQAENERQRALTVSLRARVMEGASLAQALADFPDSFPDIFRATVAAGEQSGRLDHVLERLADYAEARDALSQKILAALAYPLLLSLVALAVVTGLLTWVVPQIVGVFQNLHQTLAAGDARADRAVGVPARLGLAAPARPGRRWQSPPAAPCASSRCAIAATKSCCACRWSADLRAPRTPRAPRARSRCSPTARCRCSMPSASPRRWCRTCRCARRSGAPRSRCARAARSRARSARAASSRRSRCA